ncbi:MAG: helix-turn-helix domain-containing protein [Acidobacteriota bacterium]|nr:helix-turn-helix domain-containing protein [Acidobacteriota bacterium]
MFFLIYFGRVFILVRMSLLTTKEAAERLGVTVPRVHTFIKEGRLPAEKMGRDLFIKEADLKLLENRKTGRPPKPPAAPGKRATGQMRGSNGTSAGKKKGGKK